MKALSIYQPWCELLARGVKHFETRVWATSYRGPIALHAASVRLPAYAFSELHALLRTERLDLDALAYGAIIAVGTLAEIYPADVVTLDARERLLGHFHPDRYAWRIDAITRLDVPFPCRGAQRLWTAPIAFVERLPR